MFYLGNYFVTCLLRKERYQDFFPVLDPDKSPEKHQYNMGIPSISRHHSPRFVLPPTPFFAKIFGPPPFPSILKRFNPPIYEDVSSSDGIEILI